MGRRGAGEARMDARSPKIRWREVPAGQLPSAAPSDCFHTTQVHIMRCMWSVADLCRAEGEAARAVRNKLIPHGQRCHIQLGKKRSKYGCPLLLATSGGYCVATGVPVGTATPLDATGGTYVRLRPSRAKKDGRALVRQQPCVRDAVMVTHPTRAARPQHGFGSFHRHALYVGP